MRTIIVVGSIMVGMLASACAADSPRPNFLIILADDLGFSDVGCYGGEIATPNIDALANEGLRYTQFYNTGRCWPTRAALLTGYYAQQVRFDDFPGLSTRGNRRRPAWAPLLPTHLHPLGYRSYHSGKWHLDTNPIEGGFDRSYSLQDQDRYFTPRSHELDAERLPAVNRGGGYYATTAIADYAIEFLKEHAEKHPEQPFFEYVAFTSPHFPLQALPEDIARYNDRYQVGWDVIRNARWERVKQLLRIPGELSPLEPKIGPPSRSARAEQELGDREVWRETGWHQLTAEQKAHQSTKMAIHAAMVDRLDREIGRVLAQLHAMEAFDNTVIFFLSDNGASAEILIRGDGHDQSAQLGSEETFACLGPGWSRAANTPFRRHKTWVHEGGIATPLVVHWPAGIAGKGQLRHTTGHVIDIAPTIRRLAGDSDPWQFEGRPEAPPGKDLTGTFDADRELERDFLWWLHQGNRAIRQGKWKLVAATGEPWQLYNLDRDRTETNDLGAEHPELVRELSKLWQTTTDRFQELATQPDHRP